MKKVDKEAVIIWAVAIFLLLVVIVIPFLIAKSDLPFWFKFWLLK